MDDRVSHNTGSRWQLAGLIPPLLKLGVEEDDVRQCMRDPEE
jgi:hypothetical protein